MLANENMPTKLISQARQLICTRFQYLEVKPPLKLQTQLENRKFCKNSYQLGECPTYGKICHNCNRKNKFKKWYLRNRKTLNKLNKPKLNYLLLANTNFSLNQ